MSIHRESLGRNGQAGRGRSVSHIVGSEIRDN